MFKIVKRLAFSLFVSAILVSILIIAFAVFGSATSDKVSSQSYAGLTQNQVAAVPTVAATTPFTSTKTAFIPNELSITSVAVGQAINIPYVSEKLRYLHLVRASATPSISSLDALNIIHNYTGNSWALGGQLDGRPVTATVVFGMVTSGDRDKKSGVWIGNLNAPIRTCDIKPGGVCKDTGKRLDHIENRLAWVVSYSGLDFKGPNPACLSANCPTPAATPTPLISTRVTYLVDTSLKTVVEVDMYS